jgi:hypothetical protein
VKRLIIAGAVAVCTTLGAAALIPQTAQATDPILRMQRQIRVLQGKVASLQREVFQCEQTVNLTEYNDFQSSFGGSTYALDYTTPGDSVSDRFVIEAC